MRSVEAKCVVGRKHRRKKKRSNEKNVGMTGI
jgi:hypothetical protein